MNILALIEFLALLIGIVWVITIALLMARKDLDPVTKLTWVIVVIFVPVIGMILYFVLCTKRSDTLPKEPTPFAEKPGFYQERQRP